MSWTLTFLVLSSWTGVGNLLSNWDFEEGFPSAFKREFVPTDGWLGWEFHTWEEVLGRHCYGDWEEGEAFSGRKCIVLRMAQGFGVAQCRTVYWVPLREGEGYVLKGWYRTEGKSVATASVALRRARLFPGREEVRLDFSWGRNPHVKLKPSPGRWSPFVLSFGVSPEWTDGGRWRCWGQVRLVAISGPGKVWFDCLKLSRAFNFHLYRPKAPLLVEMGENFDVEIVALDERKEPPLPLDNLSDWEVKAGGRRLEIVKLTKTPPLWRLTVRAPEKIGLYDLFIAARRGRKKLTVRKRRFLCVVPPVKGVFSFVHITDRHVTGFLPRSVEEAEDPREIVQLEAIRAINGLMPYFVLDTGDFGTWDGWVKTHWAIICRADACLDFWRRLNAPVYAVAGNHDADATNLGVRTRWYYHVYAGVPFFFSFVVGGVKFVGLDSVMGVNPKFTTHGGDFCIPHMLDWLEREVDDVVKRGLKSVFFLHHPLFYEFEESPRRERVLQLIYRARPLLVLNGHHHYMNVTVKRNPFQSPMPSPESPLHEVFLDPRKFPFWPRPPEEIASIAKKFYNDPRFVVFENTPPIGAFSHVSDPRSRRYQGFRYVWIVNGKIAWDDVLPANLQIERERRGEFEEIVRIRKISRHPRLPWKFTSATIEPSRASP